LKHRIIELKGPRSSLQSEPSQAELAYLQLEEMIVTLQLQPGRLISENWVSQTLGLGRTPVREAMQRLAREGTLEIIPRAGAIITDIDIVDQLKLTEIRREVERVVIGRAARLADLKVSRRFADLERRFREAAHSNDPVVFIPTDREFNQLLVVTANNKYATMVMAPIQAQTRRFWYLSFHKFGELRKVSEAHAEIAEAISRNDEAGARRASDALIDFVEDYTMRTLKALL
jgi:DNA-binding GntR family transcriptional regulator